MNIGKRWCLAAGMTALLAGGPVVGQTLKIGAVLPMTGPAAIFGEKFERAYGMAIQEINDAGGVNGRKLELLIEDSQERPPIGKISTEKLVANKEVLVLTGGRSSGVTLVQAQVAEENKVPYLIDHGSSDVATMSGYRYVYRMNPTAGMYTNALKAYLTEHPPKSVVHINVDNAYGEAIFKYGLNDFMKQKGYTYRVFKYAAGELDLKPIMTQAKNANPDVVIMTAGDDNDATQLMKAAREVGLSPQMFVGTGAGHSIMGFPVQAGELAETVMTAGPWSGDRKDPNHGKYVAKFLKAYGHEPGEHEIEGYAAIHVLADVLRRAATLDREGVRKAMAETDVQTIFGRIRFENFDGYTNQNRAQTDLAQWIGGRMIAVYPKELAERDPVPFRGWK